MSHGDSFPGKAAVVPRAFVAIAGYDGHASDVGRVVTDATWHHFVNINIDGTGESDTTPLPREGLMPGGSDTSEMALIRNHWVNLADWLMPEKTRKCLRWPLVLRELVAYPLYETAVVPDLEDAQFDELEAFGAEIEAALQRRVPGFVARSAVLDSLQEAAGAKENSVPLLRKGMRYGKLSAETLGRVALAGATSAVVELVGPDRKLPTKYARVEQAAERESIAALKIARSWADDALADVQKCLRRLAGE